MNPFGRCCSGAINWNERDYKISSLRRARCQGGDIARLAPIALRVCCQAILVSRMAIVAAMTHCFVAQSELCMRRDSTDPFVLRKQQLKIDFILTRISLEHRVRAI